METPKQGGLHQCRFSCNLRHTAPMEPPPTIARHSTGFYRLDAAEIRERRRSPPAGSRHLGSLRCAVVRIADPNIPIVEIRLTAWIGRSIVGHATAFEYTTADPFDFDAFHQATSEFYEDCTPFRHTDLPFAHLEILEVRDGYGGRGFGRGMIATLAKRLRRRQTNALFVNPQPLRFESADRQRMPRREIQSLRSWYAQQNFRPIQGSRWMICYLKG